MDMKDKVLGWFGTGWVGSSSKAMALASCGAPGLKDHPYDPGDLNRCLLFLEAVPEARQHMDKVAALSPIWARLVQDWDLIESCFINEVGRNWSKAKSAPETYELMQRVMKG